MRRSILQVALASLVVFTAVGCADDTNPTVTAPTAPRDAKTPPPGDTPPGQPIPRPPVLTANDFVDITAGEYHTCARKLNNTVYCWGLDNMGQAGNDPKENIVGNCGACVDRPTLVSSIKATAIDAGDNHTCIVDESSAAYCWGDGRVGQNGYAAGSNTTFTRPTLVGSGERFNSISAGGRSTCGSGPGGLYCWGEIQQAGSPKLVSTSSAFVGVVVGALHACAIDGPSRGSFCWGGNIYGQLANGSTFVPWTPFATQALFSTAVSRIATQASFTCAEFTNGQVTCAGDNTSGQFGTGSGGLSGYPMTAAGGMSLHGVSTGYTHTCALDAGNLAWCWGGNNQGQLGMGNGTASVNPSLTPQVVFGGHTYRAVATGRLHSCAIGTDNHIYCWGDNTYGQLGKGVAGNWYAPIAALDPLP